MHPVAAAHVDVGAFVADVGAAVAAGGYEVVFGAGEAEVMALSARRGDIAAAVPYAEHGVVCRALDKAALEPAAATAGFALPGVLAVSELSGDGPVVVKARRHADPERPGAPPRVDTNVVFGAAAARRRVGDITATGAEPIVQPFLRGDLIAYVAVTDRSSRVVADSMQVASRIWPPFAGASCRARTVRVDATIADTAQRLFGILGWFGLAELQFIAPAGEAPRLIDLNGRFYGSMALAVAAGANLPATWAALATGRPVVTSRARPGVRYQWLEGDLRRATTERRGGLARDVTSSAIAAAGARHSLWDPADPAPAARRLAAITRRRRALNGVSVRRRRT